MPWLNEFEAIRYVARTDRTLRNWRTKGWVTAIKRDSGWWYDRESLRRARGIALQAYRCRRIVPGCGRGRTRMTGEALFELEESG
ncbi:hypothetical protein [Rhodococcus jostii]|uniref:hypothetical protein n=1 Tax=Rhodococcus jostii TaxID=132919 RepID=UPI00363C6669